MKKIIAFMLSFALATSLFAALTSCGNGKKNDEQVKYSWDITESNDEVILNSYTVSDAAKELIADKDYEKLAQGFTVNSRDNKTFDENTVKTVTIPENVTKISASAIDSLSFIEELVVGENVKEIELGAFSNLSSLKKITLPFTGAKKGANNAEKLFGYVFGTASTSSLTSCTQTYNDGDSGNTATYYIPTTLETVVITGEIKATEEEYKVTVKEDGTYIIDENGTQTLKFKTYKESAVQPYAFYGITTVKNVSLKGNEIFADTFNGCTALTEVIIDGTDVTVGKKAFNGCTNLVNVSVDETSFKGIKVIEESAFVGCTSLGKSDEFTLGNLTLVDAEKIEKLAFDGCTGIVTLTLKSGLDLTAENSPVKEKAFNGCTALIRVSVGETVIVDTNNKIDEKGALAKIFSSCNSSLYNEAE